VRDLLIGSVFGTKEVVRVTFTGDVALKAGSNRISLLSIAVGLPVNTPIPTSMIFTLYLIFS
jgi:hypothetical protein